jgi:hypothetical protein
MSKRTNTFQQLIHYIHEQNEGRDATVTESASLEERQIVEEQVLREIDVLIEKEVNGKIVKIAVECRDRKDRDDIKWIDSLIGKYLHLGVDKVIAVSDSGFTKGALLKAKTNNIEPRTLEEALGIDFKNEFMKLGFVNVSHEFTLYQISLECEPPISDKVTPQEMVYVKGGEESLTLYDLVELCMKEATEKELKSHLNRNFLDIFKTKEDLNKDVLVEHRVPIRELYIRPSEGVEHSIQALTIKMIGKPTQKEINLKRRFYDGALVTEGAVDRNDSDNIYTFYFVQIPAKKAGRTFMKKEKRRKKKTE